MEEKQELTCRDCECPHSHNWERGDALYIWYCPVCGNQLLAIQPPEKCPECDTLLGRKEVK